MIDPAGRGRTLFGITGRLLLRFALLAASLSWAALVVTNTIGDPDRGERIAAAVLDDDEARAEVVAPITDAVLATSGLPADRASAVEAVVDRILQDPSGARSFTDPFAGSWARLLGEDDARPAEFDLSPILDDIDVLLRPAGIETSLDATPDTIEVPAVPLPRTRLDWMGGVRRVVAGSVVPLAVVAVGLAVASFLVGERRRVLRGTGIWAILAGALWLVVPPLVVLAARSWARGADAVIATSLDEATADLRLTAVVLVLAGAGLVVASALTPVGPSPAPPAPAPPRRREWTTGPWTPDPAPAPPAPTPPTGEPTRPVPTTTPSRDDDVDSESLWDYYR